MRQTLGILREYIDLTIDEVPTGTRVFDWTVPQEWNLKEAYIADSRGRRVVDARNSNLHVLNFSGPVRATMPLEQLREHIYTLPQQPELIPYRTSYYAERWGFCMSHTQLSALPPGMYEAVIDASLTDGSLTYGEFVKQGHSEEEVLLSAHICHPSLANDNCSGLALLTLLAEDLASRPTRLTYHFLFAPGTIGAITWLAKNEHRVSRIKHGLVVSCVGDGGGPHYKKSRRGDAVIDRVMQHVLKHASPAAAVEDFSPYGYDERQYCSPGFNLPVGLFQRSRFGAFPEYHTSADNLDFISPEHLESSYSLIKTAIDVLESDRMMLNANPKCEPALGKRGLYATVGGHKTSPEDTMALLWTLNLADGGNTLLDIAEKARMPFLVIDAAAKRLQAAGLLKVPD